MSRQGGKAAPCGDLPRFYVFPFFQAVRSESIGRNASTPRISRRGGVRPPSFLSCQRYESSGRSAPCRIFLCGDVLLQIVARLRHAVLCQDRWLFCCGVRIRAKDFSPLQNAALHRRGKKPFALFSQKTKSPSQRNSNPLPAGIEIPFSEDSESPSRRN